MKKNILLFSQILCFILFASTSYSQSKSASIRGFLYEEDSGEPIGYANVIIQGTTTGAITNEEGFYSISGIEPGNYILVASFIGYDSLAVNITAKHNQVINQNFYLSILAEETDIIDVSTARTQERTEVNISTIKITPEKINRIPATGGQSDFAQYLQVLPGVISTGDQGGQIYIRGGAPVQNLILLDGMTIYNAFHSIGFFSVFETDIIRSADVYTGGFNATYGGRTSAVMDIKTREGNKKRLAGSVSANTFMVDVILEAPLMKLSEETGSSLSLLLNSKYCYLDKTSPIFYEYASETGELPYSFSDFYGKLSYTSGNGSRLNGFGFSFNDYADFEGIANYNWKSAGGGINFRIIPGASRFIMEGVVAYSNYKSNFIEGDFNKERYSGVSNFNANFTFNYYMEKNRSLKYGINFTNFSTDYMFNNENSVPFSQKQSNSEIAAFFDYKGIFGNFIVEPSIRAQYYGSLGEVRIEPRLGMKYNITDFLRVKFATGMYSQNLISSVDERDVVNLFVGYLGGPDSEIGQYNKETGAYEATNSKLQTSVHFIGGVEFNAGKHTSFNIEPYYKLFPQIVNINRNPSESGQRFDYIAEKGESYGCDFSGTYERKQLYLYGAYSYGFVKRDNGLQEYYAHFDRRHNTNLILSYQFRLSKKEKEKSIQKKFPFEVSTRWNFGTGFPLTKTQGFYEWQTFSDGILTDYLTDNNNPDTQLGIVYDDQINTGRLPDYHRLDISLKYTHNFTKQSSLVATVGVTNVYNRSNIFYFDRVNYTRIDQLPILPSMNLKFIF